MATDPVCGMEVDERAARYKHNYKGQTYYFCAEGCMKTFAADPEKHLASDDRRGRKAGSAVTPTRRKGFAG